MGRAGSFWRVNFGGVETLVSLRDRARAASGFMQSVSGSRLLSILWKKSGLNPFFIKLSVGGALVAALRGTSARLNWLRMTAGAVFRRRATMFGPASRNKAGPLSRRNAVMLVLSRKIGERLVIGDNITVVVSRVAGNRVTLGIEAPSEVRIVRGELHQVAEEAPLARHAGK